MRVRRRKKKMEEEEIVAERKIRCEVEVGKSVFC